MKQRQGPCLLIILLAGCSHKPAAPAPARDRVTLVATFEAHRPVRITTVMRVETQLQLAGKPALLWDETTVVQELCPLQGGVTGQDALDIRFRTVDWAYRENKLDDDVTCSVESHGDKRCDVSAANSSVAWTAHVSKDLQVTSDAITHDQALFERARANGNNFNLFVAPANLNMIALAQLRSFTRGTHKVGETWEMPKVGLFSVAGGPSTERWSLTGVEGTTALLTRVGPEKLPRGWKSGTIQATATADAVTGWLRSMDEDVQSVVGDDPAQVHTHMVASQRVEVMGPDQRCQAQP